MKNNPPSREAAEGEQEMTKISGNDEKYQEMTKNVNLVVGKWCCNRHNRYRRNFLGADRPCGRD